MRVKTFNTSGGEEETPEWLVNMVAQMGFQLQGVDGEPEEELSPDEQFRQQGPQLTADILEQRFRDNAGPPGLAPGYLPSGEPAPPLPAPPGFAPGFLPSGEPAGNPFLERILSQRYTDEPGDIREPAGGGTFDPQISGAPYPGYAGRYQRPGTPQSSLAALFESQLAGGHPGGVDREMTGPAGEPFEPWYDRLQRNYNVGGSPDVTRAVVGDSLEDVARTTEPTGSLSQRDLDWVAGDRSFSATGGMAGYGLLGSEALEINQDFVPDQIGTNRGNTGELPGPRSSFMGANFVGPPTGLVPGTEGHVTSKTPPFNPWNDLFTPWSDSFYGQQQVEAMNEGIDSFYSVAGARTSGGGYAGLEMYEAKIRNEGQEAADQWWDMRRKMFDLTRDQRDEARQMGMELPDPLSQARLNWNMREVLGGDGGMISQSQLEGLSPEEAQIMFNERFPEYERKQQSLAYQWEQTLPYDYGLEGNMGNQVSALLSMEADGKLPRTNDNDPMSPYSVPRYQDFDQFDHINWANWMIKSNPDIYGFPKEHTPGDRDVSGLPDGSWETPLTPDDGNAYEDSSGAYIYDAETILREYFEANVETSGMHLDRYGASQLKDMAEYVAMLLNQQQTGNNAGEAHVTTLNRVRQLRAQAGG